MNTSQRGQLPGPPNTPLEILLTESETEITTKRSKASLRRDRLLGIGIPYIKLGALVRYRPSDIRTYIESHLRGGDHKGSR
jgi:hypothetical protein